MVGALSFAGRDIEYRELELRHNSENIWEVQSDSYMRPEVWGDKIIILLSDFMSDRISFAGTPTEAAELIGAESDNPVSSRTLSRRLLQNYEALKNDGISFEIRSSNGQLLITLKRNRDDSDVKIGSVPAPPTNDPVGTVASEMAKKAAACQ